MDTEINYLNIGQAISFYKRRGFKLIDVPWRVPMKIQRLTYPLLSGEDEVKKMVGSAEQSFLWLDTEGKLGKDRYIACSPCFRKEDEYNELKRPYFMKVELYQNIHVDEANLQEMIDIAYECMYKVSSEEWWNDNEYQVVKTPEGFDIEMNGIEVGSYGIRTLDSGFSWIYGTGIAEPRFSVAMKAGNCE